MQETDLHYPADACPFCGIAAAYPDPSAKPALWSAKRRDAEKGNGEGSLEGLLEAVPEEEECGVEKTSPSSFVVMRSKNVVAFLDILPMTGGEFSFCLSFGGGSVMGGCGEV
jgi:hypothetical protein